MGIDDLIRRILNLPPRVSSYAAELDYLHYAVIGATMAGSFGLFFVAVYFLAKYRSRPGDKRTPFVQTTVRHEIAVIGSLLSLFILFWIIGFRQYLKIQSPPPDAFTVYVSAKQWMWKFSYPGGQSSAGVMYVPEGRDVKLLITSRDVIHSFFVPSFRLKQDAVPGRYIAVWFRAVEKGVFPILCAEYCGTDHSRMRADVVVLPEPEFERWLAAPDAQLAAFEPGTLVHHGGGGLLPVFGNAQPEGLVQRGLEVAASRGCLRCHTTDGVPHLGPTWRGLYGSRVQLSDGTTVFADERYLTESMMDPAAKVVSGFAPIMPTYQGQLDPGETAAILELMKALRTDADRGAQPPSSDASPLRAIPPTGQQTTPPPPDPTNAPAPEHRP